MMTRNTTSDIVPATTESATFICTACGCKFDRNHALSFTFVVNARHYGTKDISEQGEVCGKKCLMDTLNSTADKIYGIKTGAIHTTTQIQHIKGGHQIGNRKARQQPR